MRILLDQSGYMLANAGDAAMLQVAAARLAEAGCVSDVAVLNGDPERFAALNIRGRSLSTAGKRLLFRPEGVVGPLTRRIPPARPLLLRMERHLRTRAPGAYASIRRAGLRHRADAADHLSEFVDALSRADALCVSGGGFINDAFAGHGLSVLDLAAHFLAHRKPVALFGQGIGPATDPVLRRRIAEIIPRCRLVGLRESVTGPALLTELGAMGTNVHVTGDDAIEVARTSPIDPDDGGSGRLGLNVRVASYSGLSEARALRIVESVVACGRHLGAPIQPVPISWHDGDSDIEAVLPALGLDERERSQLESPLGPAGVVRLVSRCSAVFTGSYHAGVFALSRGIPVVALSASEYYDAKFLGLAAQFGGQGVTIVRPEQAESAGSLMPTMQAAIDAGPGLSGRLLERADEQIAASRDLYRQFIDSLRA